jgi:alkylated DNA nucleotide flippase Atl1
MRWPGLSTLAALAAVCAAFVPRARSAADSQPVPFSHRVHAGLNQVGCLMCHSYAQHAPVAGVPSMARCVGCHKFIGRDKPAVQLVMKMYEEGRVLEWNRVYRLPDHVFFTHERHLAARLRCQECHGAVETQDELRLAQPLTMGWCVDCHRERKAPRDCLTCHK